MRVDGFGFNPSTDALRLRYRFDYATLNFMVDPSDAKVYSNVGVFHEEHMAVNVLPTQPQFSVGGVNKNFSETHRFSFSSGNFLTANMALKTGHVVSWFIDNPSADFSYQWFKNDVLLSSFYGKTNTGVISSPFRVMEDGNYKLVIKPTTAANLSFNTRFFNANSRPLVSIADGSFISDNFSNNIRDYSKYSIKLAEGDTLSVPQGRDNIKFKLIDGLGKEVVGVVGLPLIHPVKKSGDYYLFIHNIKGWGDGYNGKVSVTKAAGVVSRRATKEVQSHEVLDTPDLARPW